MLGTIRVCDLSINLWRNMIHVLVILLYASCSYKYSYHVVDMNKYIYIYIVAFGLMIGVKKKI